jgi:hypothetical protein
VNSECTNTIFFMTGLLSDILVAEQLSTEWWKFLFDLGSYTWFWRCKIWPWDHLCHWVGYRLLVYSLMVYRLWPKLSLSDCTVALVTVLLSLSFPAFALSTCHLSDQHKYRPCHTHIAWVTIGSTVPRVLMSTALQLMFIYCQVFEW